MNNVLKYISLSVIFIALSYFVYLIINEKRKKSIDLYNTKLDDAKIKQNDNVLSEIKSIPDKYGFTEVHFPLLKGSENSSVKSLQKVLNLAYKSNLKEDGIFGDNTEKELLKRFNKKSITYNEYLSFLKLLKNYVDLSYLEIK